MKAVLRIGLVQVGEVHAHSLLSIGFFDEHNVGEPYWVIYASYEPDLQEFIGVCLNGFIAF